MILKHFWVILRILTQSLGSKEHIKCRKQIFTAKASATEKLKLEIHCPEEATDSSMAVDLSQNRGFSA